MAYELLAPIKYHPCLKRAGSLASTFVKRAIAPIDDCAMLMLRSGESQKEELGYA